MRTHTLYPLLWLGLALGAGCRSDKDTAPTPQPDTDAAADDTAADTADDTATECAPDPEAAREVLSSQCYECHGEGGVAEGGFNFALDHARLLETGLVVPGDAQGSPLYERALDEHAGQALPEEELAILEEWIRCDGADFGGEDAERAFIEDATVHERMAEDLDAFENEHPTEALYIRYVSLVHLYNAGVSEDELTTYRFGLSKLLNALSRGPDITDPVQADALGLLFRLDLRDYGWTADSEDPIDGWEHLLKDYPLGFDHGHPDGPDDALYRQLQERTTSRQPVVHADWLVWAAATPPLYHDILRVPETLDDFLDDFGVHRQDDIDSLTVQRAGLSPSDVTHHDRLIERHGADGGYCWIAYDGDTSYGEHNVFNNPLDFGYDGTATLCALPNGLSAYFLADEDGARLDAAALFLDPSAETGEAETGLSCMRCHVDGLNPATDAVREYVESVEGTGDFTAAELEAIYALYPGAGAISGQLAADTAAFQSALSETGAPVMSTDSTVALGGAFERDLTARRAAAELGLSEADFQDRLLYLPDAFQDIKPLTDETETEQTVRRDTFLSLARELRCYLDTLIEPEDPSESFCPKPGGFNQTAVACLDGQGLVEAGPDEGACITCPDGTIDVTWYDDEDGDGYGPDGWEGAVASCEPVEDHVDDGGDCDDEDIDYNPGADESDCTDPNDYNCDGSSQYDDVDGDGAPACTDCNDSDHEAYPGADEYCDGADDDCDGTIDEDGAVDALTWYADADLDGYADPDTYTEACEPGAGAIENDGSLPWDCDDSEPLVHPETVWYADADRDGYGDPNDATVVCEYPAGTSILAGDCDDANASVNPAAAEVCDGVDNDCDDPGNDSVDDDGDGYVDEADERTGEGVDEAFDVDDGVDNDGDGAVDERGEDVIDGLDDDGDGDIDESGEDRGDGLPDAGSAADASLWYPDTDGDGHPDGGGAGLLACEQPSGYASDGVAFDCDDSDSAASPSHDELCTPAGGTATDEDCDGDIDESGAADAGAWYPDSDGDGYGDEDGAYAACAPPAGYITDDGSGDWDCDDTDAGANPGAIEVCDDDDTDEDCDGLVDDDDPGVTGESTWYSDADGDGYGDPDVGYTACDVPSDYAADAGPESWDCDDLRADVNPGATEVCDDDKTDEDCSGLADDEDPFNDPASESSWAPDEDGDGYTDDGADQISACEQPGSGYLPDALGDCDDDDASVHPAAEEVCDGIDNDCDDDVDVDASDAVTWYADADGDGVGLSDDALTACDQPAGYVSTDGDCDDDDAGVGVITTWYPDDDADGYGDADDAGAVSCAALSGYVADDNTDCDDGDADTNPDAWDAPRDEIDQDCDGFDACDPTGVNVYEGDLSLTSQAEVDGFCDDYDTAGGALSISGSDVTDLEALDCLCGVEGALTISSTGLTDVPALPLLETVGGDLTIGSNGSLIDVSGFSSLTAAEGFLQLTENGALETISGFAALEAVEGGVYVVNDEALTELGGFDALTDVGGYVVVASNGALVSIDGFDALETIGNYVQIYSNDALVDVGGFGALTSIAVELNISENVALTDISGFDALETVGAWLLLDDNDAMTTLDAFPSLVSVGDAITIQDHDVLHTVDGFDALTGVTADLEFDDNLYLASITGFNALETVGGELLLSGDALADISGFTALTEVGTLRVSNAEDLTTLDGLDALTTVGELNLFSNGYLYDISALAGLTATTEGVSISQNGALNDLDGLEGLVDVGGSFSLYANNIADISALSSLTSIGVSLTVQYEDALLDLDGLGGLESIGGDLSIIGCDAFESLDGMDALTEIGGLYLKDNARLHDLSGLSLVTGFSSAVTIDNNDALLDLDGVELVAEISDSLTISENLLLSDVSALSGLTWIGRHLYIRNNTALSDLSALTGLTEIAGSLSIYNNDSLVDLSGLSGLTAIGTERGFTPELEIDHNDALTDISALSGVTASLEGTLSVSSNPSLTSLVGLEGIDRVYGYLDVSYNDALTDLTGLDGLELVLGVVTFRSNDSLVSLDRLGSLAAIGDENEDSYYADLIIDDNISLTDVTALHGVIYIEGDLEITDNTSLATADADALHAAIISVGGDVTISGNAP